MKRYGLLFSWWLAALPLFGQNLLDNPSFERHNGRAGWMPEAWINAGPVTESPPDVHTADSEIFGVRHRPAAGDTYLGMVARDNFTFEAIAQRIPGGLRAGQTYELQLWVSRSEELRSQSRLTRAPVTYDAPIPFDVYVSNKANGDHFELVARSAPITHSDWRLYTIAFTPTRNWKYLRIGAGMNVMSAKPQCGNILIDDLSLTVADHSRPDN